MISKLDDKNSCIYVCIYEMLIFLIKHTAFEL